MSIRSDDNSGRITKHEAALLKDAGFRDDARMAAFVMDESRRALDELVSNAGSVSLTEAAKLLGVTASQVLQRLEAERTLYGMKQGTEWRVLLFQFEGERLVPNIDKVFPALSPDVHPLAVRAFFLLESPDLVISDGADEHPMSPLAWLSAGHPPDVVIALALTI